MNRRTFLTLGLATILNGCVGIRENPVSNRIGNPIQLTGLYHPQPRVINIIRDSISGVELPFDDAFNTARKIVYKNDLPFCNYMPTPQEVESRGTGDCKSFAIYLSKLLTDKRIYNELVFGQANKADGFVLHVWNRAYLDYFGVRKFTLDAASNLRLLESEVPIEDYREYCSYHLTDYSRKGIEKMNRYIQSEERLAAFRNTITGNPKKKILGGRVR